MNNLSYKIKKRLKFDFKTSNDGFRQKRVPHKRQDFHAFRPKGAHRIAGRHTRTARAPVSGQAVESSRNAGRARRRKSDCGKAVGG